MVVLDLLDCHRAVKFLVEGDRDLTQAPLGMWAEDAKPAAGGRGFAQARLCDGTKRVIVRSCRGDVGQAGLDLGIGDVRQILAHRADRAQRRQAFFWVVAVELDVLFDQSGQEQVPGRREPAAIE